ncbi:MAG: hypothetical protein J6A21_09560 [Lentisphaeria bacterium]|nr:hypothetical protein [Lentisphaeria bacterium]
MKLSLDHFTGLIPIRDAHALPETAAQTALNCTTESGKVALRTLVPEWEAPSALTSEVSGRKYDISGGLVREDGISLHMAKPEAPTLEKVEYWTIGGGYTGVKGSPKIRLKTTIGVSGSETILDIAESSCDASNGTFQIKFVKPGAYFPANTAMIFNDATADNCSLFYNNQDFPLSYPCQISIPDADNGIYATLYVSGVEFTTQKPDGYGAPGGIVINTVNIIVKGNLIKNKSRRNYVVTFWDGRHESPPSNPSEEIDICKGDTVKVTIPAYSGGHGTHVPDHPDNAPAYYIYRTGGSLSSAGYYFVAEMSSPGVYTDTVQDYLLQEKLSIVESPQEGMDFLNFFNFSLVAAKGNHVYFSEPNIFNSWPSKYEYTFPDTVTALSVTQSSIVVFVKDHSPVILKGVSPDALAQITLDDTFTCLSTNSVCKSENNTYYAAPEGLALISPSGECKIITREFFSREQWEALGPSSMKCSADNYSIRIYLSSNHIYIFDLLSGGMVLTEYDGGSNYIWKTPVFTFSSPVCFRLVRATTANGEGILTVTAGNDLGVTATTVCAFPNGRAVRLRPNIFSRQWCFQVESSSPLLEIEAAESPTEIY